MWPLRAASEMPFIRQIRDKRGNETTIVMHAYRPSGGAAAPQRARVLYLFRSPANLAIGRRPLDGEVVEALEHTHPDLTFDWNALRRDTEVARAFFRERPARPSRPGRPGRPKAVPVPRVVDDQSVLGRTLGAADAGRLRAAYAELVLRVTRRARTPEERDRLLERLGRLNPDEWPDEVSIRAAAASVDAEWQAVIAELPSRRRGRRGGRRREAGQPGAGDPAAQAADGSEAPLDLDAPDDSGIMVDDAPNPDDHDTPPDEA